MEEGGCAEEHRLYLGEWGGGLGREAEPECVRRETNMRGLEEGKEC